MFASSFVAYALLGAAVARVLKRQPDLDFSGTGNILVTNGSNRGAIVGCINAAGMFISDRAKCGVFTAPDTHNQLRSTDGYCTFNGPFDIATVGNYPLICEEAVARDAGPYIGSGLSDPGPGKAWVYVGSQIDRFFADHVPEAEEELFVWLSGGGLKARYGLLWQRL